MNVMHYIEKGNEILLNVSLSLGKSYCSINCITHRNLNVDREVLLIEVSLLVLFGGYFFHPAKFEQLQEMRKIETIKLSQLHKNLLDRKLLVCWDYEQLLRANFF